jgi:hypothetical protein
MTVPMSQRPASLAATLPPTEIKPPPTGGDSQLREPFTQFVGETLFGSLLASMRATQGKPAYLHGGRTEEVFQGQLDQAIVEQLTEASADTIAEPMYELFQLQRRS